MTEKPVDNKTTHGFLAGLLGDIPAFVRGILATMFGTTICLVAMLQLGGLQVPVTNYLTAQLRPQMVDLAHSVEALRNIVSRVEAVESAQGLLSHRTAVNEVKIDELDRRAQRIERRLGISQ